MKKYKYISKLDLMKNGAYDCTMYSDYKEFRSDHMAEEGTITIVLDSNANCGRGCRNFYYGRKLVMERFMFPPAGMGLESNIAETSYVSIGDLNDLIHILKEGKTNESRLEKNLPA